MSKIAVPSFRIRCAFCFQYGFLHSMTSSHVLFFVLLGVVYLIDAIEMELLKLPHVLLAMCTVKRMYTVYYMLVVMVMVSGALAPG